MSQVTVYPTWVGQEARVPAPMPSWMAPPLPDALPETPPLRVSLLPSEGVRLYSSLGLPVDAPPCASVAPPSHPPPPPYPDLRAEYASPQAQLAATVDAMAQLRGRILESSEPQLVALACAIGERIAGRELRADPEIVVGWAREAIDKLGSDGSVVVAVSPDIAATLRDTAWAPVRSASVKIETDTALAAGSCEVRSSCSSLDASVASRAEAVRREVVGVTT